MPPGWSGSVFGSLKTRCNAIAAQFSDIGHADSNIQRIYSTGLEPDWQLLRQRLGPG